MVQGLDKLKARWGAIPQKVREAVSDAMEKAADDLVKDMRATVGKKSGKLAASIGWTWGEAPKGSMVIGKVAKNEYATMQITIYAGGKEAFWGRFQEFGTRKMRANPFFFPIYRARRRSIKTRIGRAMNKAIRNG